MWGQCGHAERNSDEAWYRAGMRFVISFGLVLVTFISGLLMGCGGNVVFDEASDGQAGSTAESTSQTSGTFPDGTITPVVDELQLIANCIPDVGPDPVSGTVTVTYFNTSDEARSLELLGASLGFSTDVEAWVFFVEFDPTSSGPVPANSQTTVIHEKTKMQEDSSFICSLCDLPMTVQLSFRNEQGGDIIVTENTKLDCSF